MKRVATSVIEVRAGRVVDYRGDYESYLYYVNKEIEEGEREQAAKAAPARAQPSPKLDRKQSQQAQREARKEVASLERTIARLDDRKRQLNSQLLETTDAAEALRLHNEITAIDAELRPAEDRWCLLQEQVNLDSD